jgi:magnesium transporter
VKKFIRKRSEKAGLSPGSLVYIGPRKQQPLTLEAITYSPATIEKVQIKPEDCAGYKTPAGIAWINIDGISDVSALEQVGKTFDLHPLTLEDVLNTEQRPKLEEYDSYLFIVLKMLRPGATPLDEIIHEQVSFILYQNLLLTFQEDIQGDVFTPVRERLQNAKGRIRTLGADYLCYALIDAVVDNYFSILENFGERIEDLEEDLITNPSSETLSIIHHMKRELIYLRKSVWPLREVIAGLQRLETPLMSKGTGIFLRDVYDHTIQVIDTIETYRDMLSGMIDVYMSSISNRMNEIMKVLTIISTVFIPLTFLAGVYGMNFKYMPELEMRWTYPALWVFMLAVAGGMFLFFRKKKWL